MSNDTERRLTPCGSYPDCPNMKLVYEDETTTRYICPVCKIGRGYFNMALKPSDTAVGGK